MRNAKPLAPHRLRPMSILQRLFQQHHVYVGGRPEDPVALPASVQGGVLSVVLGAERVRIIAIPPSNHASTAFHRRAARKLAQQEGSEANQDVAIATEPAHPDKATLAAVVDASVIAQLRTLARARGARLLSCVPLLSYATSRFSQTLADRDLLIMLEPGNISAFHRGDGKRPFLVSLPYSAPDAAVAALVARWTLEAPPLPEGRVHLLAPPEFTTPTVPGIALNRLTHTATRRQPELTGYSSRIGPP